MFKKIIFVIAWGAVGLIIGVAAYLSKIYFPAIWKNSDAGSIDAFILLGFAGGCMIAYLWAINEGHKK